MYEDVLERLISRNDQVAGRPPANGAGLVVGLASSGVCTRG
jgi:hypothetical protein